VQSPAGAQKTHAIYPEGEIQRAPRRFQKGVWYPGTKHGFAVQRKEERLDE